MKPVKKTAIKALRHLADETNEKIGSHMSPLESFNHFKIILDCYANIIELLLDEIHFDA